MKLRIAHMNDAQRMGGKFVVQRRSWGCWDDMYFNTDTKVLKEEMELGRGKLVRAAFDDFHEAMKYARIFNSKAKLIIREVWKV